MYISEDKAGQLVQHHNKVTCFVVYLSLGTFHKYLLPYSLAFHHFASEKWTTMSSLLRFSLRRDYIDMSTLSYSSLKFEVASALRK